MVQQLAIDGGPAAVRRPLQPFNGIGAKEKAAVLDFLDSGRPLSGFHGSAQPTFFGGEQVRAFEAAWMERFGVAHAVTVNSATSALMAAMGAIGIGPGDEVITSPYTMTATAMAVIAYGGIPVFADIEPDYFCLDPVAVEKAITPKTRAIIAVNIFGHPAELQKLRALADDRGIYLIEDNAQAVIAHENNQLAGTIGHIGVYSLNIHKHIQTGEGGLCVTSDPALARRMQLIRNHGENVVDWLNVEDLTNLIGYNYRLPEISAAIGRAQLERLDELVDRAEAIANALTRGVSGLRGITPPKVRNGCRHNYFMWSCKIDENIVGVARSAFCKALAAEGVPLAEGYVRPIYLLPMFQKRIAMGRSGFPFNLSDRIYAEGMCPVVERMRNKELFQFQPVSWDADREQINMIAEAFHKVHANRERLIVA